MSDFEKVKEELPSKVKFYSSLTDRNVSDKNINNIVFLMFPINLR